MRAEAAVFFAKRPFHHEVASSIIRLSHHAVLLASIKCSFNGNTCKSSVKISIEEKYVDVYRTTAHRNEWNGYNQEMAWEAVEEEWRRATDSRDFEPEDLLHTDEHPYCDDPACWCHRCEQEIPFTDEEIEAIMSADADNKDADELEQGKHDWLSEHL